jgi:hypothetical protein
VDLFCLIACTTGVYADCCAVPLTPNSASLLMPIWFSARMIGIVAAIVDGTSLGIANTPCIASLPNLLR